MVKVDIVSGFLGAGKTTFIQKLLKEALTDRKVVLIENEFGEIGIDGGFLQESGVEIREINSGCICCSLVGDFKISMQEVLQTYKPDCVLIEPSGVGKLSEIIQAVENASEQIEITGKVTVVDVNKCKMYLKNFGEFFLDQVEQANTIILSRTGIASAEKIQKTVELLRQHNKHAVIVTTPWEQLSGEMLLMEIERTVNLEEELLIEVKKDHSKSSCGHDHHTHDETCTCGHDHHTHDETCTCGHDHHTHDETCTCGHDHHTHDETCTCGHDHHTHDETCTCGHDHHIHDHYEHGETCSCGHNHHASDVFVSWGMETTSSYNREHVEKMLNKMEEEELYGTVLRAKGMLPCDGDAWLYFDYVPGEVTIRTGKPAVTGKICVIGSDLKQNLLQQLFQI